MLGSWRHDILKRDTQRKYWSNNLSICIAYSGAWFSACGAHFHLHHWSDIMRIRDGPKIIKLEDPNPLTGLQKDA